VTRSLLRTYPQLQQVFCASPPSIGIDHTVDCFPGTLADARNRVESGNQLPMPMKLPPRLDAGRQRQTLDPASGDKLQVNALLVGIT